MIQFCRIHTTALSIYIDTVNSLQRPIQLEILSIIRETLINSANEMKHEAHGTQQPRHINKIGEGASTAQRSDSLVSSINQHFLRNKAEISPYSDD
ncbi:MAG: hypothetical protein A4S08_10475 [Proteobacteria bacterium SG_bin4]|nr:MAG: hypothetical protein A4S08_10475 [Proteobacteria bacterium SG_bin4]